MCLSHHAKDRQIRFWTVIGNNLAVTASVAPAPVAAAQTSGPLQQQRRLSSDFAPLAS
jgi:hypothetical protein